MRRTSPQPVMSWMDGHDHAQADGLMPGMASAAAGKMAQNQSNEIIQMEQPLRARDASPLPARVAHC